MRGSLFIVIIAQAGGFVNNCGGSVRTRRWCLVGVAPPLRHDGKPCLPQPRMRRLGEGDRFSGGRGHRSDVTEGSNPSGSPLAGDRGDPPPLAGEARLGSPFGGAVTSAHTGD